MLFVLASKIVKFSFELCGRNCLLDSLPQDKLDGVDVIVFDPAAPLRVRQEALAFIMDHTEGFDDEDNADSLEGALNLLELERHGGDGGNGAAKSKKRSSKGTGTGSKADQARALARRQRTAQQLETLTEFAEMHLGALVERSYMLTDACLALKKYGEGDDSFYLYLPAILTFIFV